MKIGQNPDIVMVERETYDAMVAAYNRVKVERLRNKQTADHLDGDLELLQHEVESLSSRISEFNTVLSGLVDTINKNVNDEGLKESLKEKLDSVSFSVGEMHSKSYNLLDTIRGMKTVIKPFKDYKG